MKNPDEINQYLGTQINKTQEGYTKKIYAMYTKSKYMLYILNQQLKISKKNQFRKCKAH